MKDTNSDSMNNQTTYIGVRGKRGSGKPTVSYLLAGTIDWYVKNRVFDESFDEYYNSLIQDITDNPNDFLACRAFDYVYLESFSDTQRVMCGMLLGTDIDNFYNSSSKECLKVDLTTLEVSDVTDTDQLITAEERLSGMSGTLMTLSEFCTYFSLTLQQMIGPDLWIQSLDKHMSTGTPFKVFYDVKLPGEVSYILDRKGYIIKAVRPGHEKRSTTLSSKLDNDRRVNFEVSISGDDMTSCREDLKEIVQIIVDGKAVQD